MFELLSVIVFVWLLIKAISLALKLTWGMAKIIAGILIVLALPMLIVFLLFVGGAILIIRSHDRYSSRNYEVLHQDINTEL